MADKIATRQAYGEALIELVEKNDKVVVLDADLANATQTCKVAKAHPEKFYNCGIAEANMVDIAAGMSTMGLIPYCSSFAMFAPAAPMSRSETPLPTRTSTSRSAPPTRASASARTAAATSASRILRSCALSPA